MSNALPSDAQRDYANTFPAFQNQMQGMGQRLGGMLNGFVNQHAPHAQQPGQGADDDMSDRFDSIVDLTDRMLERVDADLDRHQALAHSGPAAGGSQQQQQQLAHGGSVPVAQQQQQQQQQQQRSRQGSGSGSALPAAAMGAGGSKPQSRWRHEIDNSSQPFMPKLRTKPNAVAPLELRLEQPDDNSQGLQPWYANPYTAELSAFAPSDGQLAAGRERLYSPLHATPCTWVDTEALLGQMIGRLAGCAELAIDLESHSYRSYRGFTCLMQIRWAPHAAPQPSFSCSLLHSSSPPHSSTSSPHRLASSPPLLPSPLASLLP